MALVDAKGKVVRELYDSKGADFDALQSSKNRDQESKICRWTV